MCVYPLHIITAHILPYWNEEIKELQNRLVFMIKSLKKKCQRQRIIVMGDFNFPIKDKGKILNKEGLKESIPEGVETHKKGSQLDQIYSNVETINWETWQLRLTDHKLIQVNIRINFQDDDLKITDRERTIRITDIRKQSWKTFVEGGRELTLEDLDNPIQKCFSDKIEKQVRGTNWCQQPPEWVLRNNGTSQTNVFQEFKTKQKEATNDLEHCLDKNDLKGFFYMAKRLTKSQKDSQPIKGLKIKEKRIEAGEITRKTVVEFYTQLFKDKGEQQLKIENKRDVVMIDEKEGEKFCETKDAELSIQECNFKKAI
ncbi:hypothetical protein OXYTRIMIC_112 [Oxytricha trifallax]|uniref:Endonuclease/exonuclease/phosphatase domain-containing protein n=1 Tax=Oxytricha trifallax TaxID=1172189 RepID=A0A073I072_9SPIT|nr:hypothetical protein OXYTRIMIC_112 [Oxytricha trifallax]